MMSRSSNPVAPEHICIVEPDSAVRDSLRSFIQFYDKQVRTFENGAALQRVWPGTGAQGVVCAAQLPDMSGIELYQWLTGHGFDQPFALTVSKHQHQLIAAASKAGIFHILHKPLLPSTSLIRFIDQLSDNTNIHTER